jgi:hypothetical protein
MLPLIAFVLGLFVASLPETLFHYFFLPTISPPPAGPPPPPRPTVVKVYIPRVVPHPVVDTSPHFEYYSYPAQETAALIPYEPHTPPQAIDCVLIFWVAVLLLSLSVACLGLLHYKYQHGNHQLRVSRRSRRPATPPPQEPQQQSNELTLFETFLQPYEATILRHRTRIASLRALSTSLRQHIHHLISQNLSLRALTNHQEERLAYLATTVIHLQTSVSDMKCRANLAVATYGLRSELDMRAEIDALDRLVIEMYLRAPNPNFRVALKGLREKPKPKRLASGESFWLRRMRRVREREEVEEARRSGVELPLRQVRMRRGRVIG